MAKIKIVEGNSLPICPHCKKVLETIERLQDGLIEQHSVYICPHCKALLSVGYNFWM